MEEREINIAQLKAEKCRRSFWYFVQEFWKEADPSEPVWNWHMKEIADHLQNLNSMHKKGQEIILRKDTIINISPGTSKSMIVSVLFPAWLWIDRPHLKIISASYSASIAIELATKSRNLIGSSKYKEYFPDTRIKRNDNNKTNYKTTYNGFRYCTSPGSSLLGIHADVIICDDLENLTSIESDTQRETVHEWFKTTLSTRLTDKSRSYKIIVQQRLSNKDLTSALIKSKKKYKMIVLPARLSDKVQPEELRSKYINGLLDPVRLSEDILNDMQDSLGSRAFNAQFGQDPDADEQSIIKKQWLKLEHLNIDHSDRKKFVRFWFLDSAYGGEKSDYTALLECFKFDNKIFITNVFQFKLEFPELIKKITEIIPQDFQSKLYVEGKASGKSIIQYLRSSTKFNVVELPNNRDNKIQRLTGISPIVEGQRVILLKDQSWNKEFIDQITKNNPTNDDMRDVFVFAVETLLTVNQFSGNYSFI